MQTVRVGAQEFLTPFAHLLPGLAADELEALREDVRERGIVVPVLLDETGAVLDGHHRLRVAAELGLEAVPFEVRAGLDDAEREALAYGLNLHRRHLTPEVLRALRARGWSYRKIAETACVSESTVRGACSGEDNAAPEQVTGLDGKTYPATLPPPEERAARAARHQQFAGEGRTVREIAAETGASVGTVHRDLKMPTVVVRATTPGEAAKAQRVLEQAPEGLDFDGDLTGLQKAVARATRDARREVRLETLREQARPLNGGLGRFPVLLADPPWRYEHVVRDEDAIEHRYPSMALEDICALPVATVATETAVLFLWTTSPKLREAFAVVDAWGFVYRTCMVWVKDGLGMGHWARQNHELLLICARGDFPPPPPAARSASVFTAPKGRHSEKPALVYELIERMYPGLPRLELFAREAREGWAAWGNESGGPRET